MPSYCPNCGFDNRDAASFCKQCGAALPQGTPPATSSHPTTWQPASSPPASPGMFPRAVQASTCLVDQNGQRYPLGGLTTVGRETQCTIVLSDPSVSGQHATIVESGGQWQVTDGGSRNGTLVNGMRIVSPCMLNNGDGLAFGGAILRFETADSGTVLLDPSQMGQTSSSTSHTGASPGGVVPSAKGGLFAPQARGRVLSPPNERQDQPPVDWARITFGLALGALFVGAFLAFAVFAITAGIVLLCLGGAVLVPILFMLWAPVQMLFRAVIGALKDDKPVSIVNLQIEDEISGYPMDVTFVRKRGTGGGVAQGDVIEVWGSQRGGAAIIATKVRVIERQKMPTSAYIPTKKSWPWWIAVTVWGLTIAALVYAYISLGGTF